MNYAPMALVGVERDKKLRDLFQGAGCRADYVEQVCTHLQLALEGLVKCGKRVDYPITGRCRASRIEKAQV